MKFYAIARLAIITNGVALLPDKQATLSGLEKELLNALETIVERKLNSTNPPISFLDLSRYLGFNPSSYSRI